MQEIGETLDGQREAVAAGRKAQAEMRRLSETVARRDQNTSFGKSLAERASGDAVFKPIA